MPAMFPVVLASARIGGVYSLGDERNVARVIVFLDSQNVCMGAREEYALRGAPSRFGQTDPLALARLIVANDATRRGSRAFGSIEDCRIPSANPRRMLRISGRPRYMRSAATAS